jgi:glycosyltransferase involved in cell wall biosynthesis
MKPTILTACYNCGPWIKQCIKSVFKQEFKDWEWIIVNDRSTDNSLKIMEKYARKNENIRIINNDSSLKCGGSYAKALEHATGDICCVLDADDMLAHKKSLSRLVRLYEKYPDVAYIWSQFRICDPDMNVVKKGSCRLPDTSFLKAGLDYSKYRHCFSHWRTFRTELRDSGDIFNKDLPAAVDKWMGYRLEELGVGGFYSKALYLYRQRVGGLSYKGRKHWSKMLKIFDKKRKEQEIEAYPTIKLSL